MRYLDKADEEFLQTATSPDPAVRETKIRELRRERTMFSWFSILLIIVFLINSLFKLYRGLEMDLVGEGSFIGIIAFFIRIYHLISEIQLRLFIDKQIRDNNHPAPLA